MKFSLREIAERFDFEVVGDDSLVVTRLAPPSAAGPGDLTFLFNSAYKTQLSVCQATAVVLTADDAADCSLPHLIAQRPRLAWAQIATLFDPTPRPAVGSSPSATVAEDASIGSNVSIGANVVIESGVVVGDDVILGPGVIVGSGSEIGARTRIFGNVSIYHDVVIGEDCIVHSGAVIGADGFGFEFNPASMNLTKIPQVYGVRIGNHVEVGAGTTIDRGALNHTVLGDGVKLDNQVQIGHGATIGAHTAISGCTAVAGSTKVGSYCLIGGGVGIVDNIEVADQVEITAMSLVSQSITEKGRYASGTGLMKGAEWKRSIVGFRRLDEMLKRIRKLEQR